MRLEEQRPPDNLVWSFLVRVINGNISWDNWKGKQSVGVTPFIVPGYYGGGLVLKQSAAGNVSFIEHEDGMQVVSSPSGMTVLVRVF